MSDYPPLWSGWRGRPRWRLRSVSGTRPIAALPAEIVVRRAENAQLRRRLGQHWLHSASTDRFTRIAVHDAWAPYDCHTDAIHSL